MIGLEHDRGVREAGLLAYIILLDSDPLADIRILQDKKRIRALFKGGEAVDLAEPVPAMRWPWEKSLEISQGELRYDAVYGRKAAE